MENVFLNCRISLGAFSGERVFEVPQVGGPTYIGLSPLHYCYDANGNTLRASEPAPGKFVDGRVAARRIGGGDDFARVAIPDGRAIKVRNEFISQRPRC